MHFRRWTPAVAALGAGVIAAVAGCGGSSSAGATASPTPSPSGSTPGPTPTATPASVLTGQLVGGTGAYPGGIGGVHFRTATQSGVTGADGAFTYRAGESVIFSVGDVDFRTTDGAPMLSPWQLSADGSCAQSAALVRALVLLDSLDADGDPATGIAVPATEPSASQVSFADLTDDDVAARIDALIPGRTPVAAGGAVDAFITQMDGELWQQVGSDSFAGTTGLVRSQGVTTDGSAWYFSWTHGLERTDLSFNTLASNNLAIPVAQAILGDNHIGDIDFANGTLFVPLEDGSAYQNPYLATYDPVSLTATNVVAVSNTLMTAGVPWVAADAPRGNVYIAQWDPTPEIFVFDMATLAQTGSIPLSTTLSRIQGAKVFEGSLYLSTDDADKDIYKVNLDTGTVIPLFAFHQDFEEEGLAFLPMPDGSLMHTLNVDGLGMAFRHHQRTRAPLRQSICTAP